MSESAVRIRRTDTDLKFVELSGLDLTHLRFQAQVLEGHDLRLDRARVATNQGDGLVVRFLIALYSSEADTARLRRERNVDMPFAMQRDTLVLWVISRNGDSLVVVSHVPPRIEVNGELLRGTRLDRAVGPTVEASASASFCFDVQVPFSIVANVEGAFDLLAGPYGLRSHRGLGADPAR
jgi:hypothetical protein